MNEKWFSLWRIYTTYILSEIFYLYPMWNILIFVHSKSTWNLQSFALIINEWERVYSVGYETWSDESGFVVGMWGCPTNHVKGEGLIGTVQDKEWSFTISSNLFLASYNLSLTWDSCSHHPSPLSSSPLYLYLYLYISITLFLANNSMLLPILHFTRIMGDSSKSSSSSSPASYIHMVYFSVKLFLRLLMGLMTGFVYRCSIWSRSVWYFTWPRKNAWKLSLSMQISTLL